MCGRYTLSTDLKKVAKRFGAEADGMVSTKPRYNIAPTQTVIVVKDDGQRHLVQMRWGLIPSWAKDPSIGNRMINARAETLAEKPAFRAALKKRRCIIPADGFYEWTTLDKISQSVQPSGLLMLAFPVRAGKIAGKMKQAVRIVLKSREPFGFAGLWEHWKSPDGEEILSCTIITTEANDLLKAVHERMPVILTRDAEAAWLDQKTQDPEKLLPLLKQYPPEEMEFYPVSRAVNSPATDAPNLIEPIVGDGATG
jgi:putative SOS response-associated peptidase YedK